MSSRFPIPFRSSSSHPALPSSDAPSNDTGATDDPSPHQTLERPPQQHRSTTSTAALSTSFSQRTPARSFVHHASLSQRSADALHYPFADVREQTASLAQNHLSLRRPSSVVIDDVRPRLRQDSYASSVPEAIDESQEEEEPSQSGADESVRPRSHGLADLFNNDSGPSSKAHFPSVDRSSSPRGSLHLPVPRLSQDMPTETTPLLKASSVSEAGGKLDQPLDDVESGTVRRLRKPNKLQQLLGVALQRSGYYANLFTSPKRWSAREVWNKAIIQPVGLLPCVFLGVLLNVLDALSYGMILFPLGEPIFAKTGPDGISMFYVSCIVSQLVYSCGGSIFRGAVGSEMIEVVPFFHKMTYSIIERTGTANPKVVMATVITSYALSSILTGIVFFALGAFKLGSLVSFFPRHILIGCIGGVGFFLFVTGIEVSARLDGNLEYNLQTLKALFDRDTVALWTIPLGLAIVLMTAKSYITAPKVSPYIVPVFFILVAAIFYIVVTATPSLNIPQMRDGGWIFAEVEAGVPFYHFYSYYDFGAVDWDALAATVPAMFALTFFGILHVPINVPALAVAAKEDDLNLNRELVAHGFSNALSGLCGSIQNYLVYVNSELFMSNGGDNRLAGIMLAFATFGVLVAGPEMIGYVPIMVVGALIFYLGIDLLNEALVDTWGKMGSLEYLTVVAIVLIMGVYDFVAGILTGIVLACLAFVLQTASKSAIRATYSGDMVESTVRRHPVQRLFLHEVGYQIYVSKLAGYLFFGSIVAVEKNSRALIEEEAFRKQPIRYLIFDLAHVSGIDYSAAEAFVRMQRVIQRRGVRMIVSGAMNNSDVGAGLRNVGLWRDDSEVQFFESLNGALEYCENELLKVFYREQTMRTSQTASPASLDVPGAKLLRPNDLLVQSPVLAAASPRQNFLAKAASTTLDNSSGAIPSAKWASFAPPLPLLLQTFQDISPHRNEDFWFRAVPYFKRQTFPAGTLVFSRGDTAEEGGFILLESGILRASYILPVGNYHESIVAGTTCGELPFFSGTKRTATVIAERDCVGWVLFRESWERMQTEWPEGAAELLRCALRLTKERVDAITGYVVAVAG